MQFGSNLRLYKRTDVELVVVIASLFFRFVLLITDSVHDMTDTVRERDNLVNEFSSTRSTSPTTSTGASCSTQALQELGRSYQQSE
jgi:hypothetical protein